jgi:hypothetical protein
MSSETVLPASVPRCAIHRDVAAAGMCPRCGNFLCAACTVPVLGVEHCAACAARPEVNYLETLRQRLWGRRDLGAWGVGAGSVLLLFAALGVLPGQHGLLALCLAAWAFVGVAFFLGQPWARHGLLAAPLVLGVLGTALEGPWLLVPLLIAFLFALSLHQDARNQLFFRREVSTGRLRHLWEVHVNNPLARHALTLAVLSLVMPLVAPAAIVCGAWALQRVNPRAVPPIGRRGCALLAMAVGCGSLLLWATVLGPLVRQGLSLVLQAE